MPVPTDSLQLACPSCGEAELHRPRVDGTRFDACCPRCQHWWQSPLPELARKVIVLDTNVLSEITKLRSKSTTEEKKQKLERWTEVVSRIEEANALQAIICPEIPTLSTELRLTPDGTAIAEVASEFSHGVLFRQRYPIECQQLHNALLAHRRNDTVASVARRDAFIGDLSQWRTPLLSTEKLKHSADPAYIREVKQQLHSNSRPVLHDWAETAQSIDALYCRQLHSYGPRIIQEHKEYLEALSNPALDPDDYLCISVHVMTRVRESLESLGVPPEASLDEAIRFLESEQASMIPANRVAAALFAYESRQLAGDMQNLASSFWFDVEMLSTVLPYCDAILTEGHLAGALRSIHRFLPSECQDVRVFSVRDLSNFESYLDELIAAVPADQRAAAEALYLGKRG